MHAFSFQQFWINGLLVIPAAVVVWMMCRTLRVRAATRHALWLVVLALLVLPTLIRGVIAPQWPAEISRAMTLPLPHEDSTRNTDELPAEDEIVTDEGLLDTEAGLASRPALIPSEIDVAEGPLDFDPRSTESARIESHARENSSSNVSPFTDEPTTSAPIVSPVSAIGERTATLDQSPPVTHKKSERSARATSVFASARESLREWFAQLLALRDAFVRMPSIPPVLWIGGILAVAFAVLFRLVQMRRIVAAAEPAPPEMISIVRRAARRIGLAGPPEVRITEASIPPLVWCAGRPILVLPHRLWDQLDDASRLAVIFHELAHLRRRDHWLCWVEMLCGVLFWWNPVVWWACRQVRDEADACCDAWVVRLQPTGRRAYAQALLASTSVKHTVAFAGPVVGLGALRPNTRRFARRLTMVMTEQLRPGMSIRGGGAVIAVAAAACLVAPILACPPEEHEEATLATVSAPSEASSASAATTYEAYVQDRASQATDEYANALTYYTTAASQDPFAGGDVEARLSALEARLDHIAELLGELGLGMADEAAAPTTDWVETEPAASDIAYMTADPDTITCPYALPEDKLREFTELMILQDVPILVTPRLEEGLIDVHASREQHEILQAFFSILHPEGVKVSEEQYYDLKDANDTTDLRETDKESLKQEKDELAAELEAAKSQKDGYETQESELEAAIEQLEAHLEELAEMAENASGEDKQALNDEMKKVTHEIKLLDAARKQTEREKKQSENHADDIEAAIDDLDEQIEVLEELAAANDALGR